MYVPVRDRQYRIDHSPSTFFKPDDLIPHPGAGRQWFVGLLARFENFWDSESPRVGETAARGWNRSTSDPPPVLVDPVPQPELSSNDPFERWLEAEKRSDKYRALPGRATNLDDADEDDPYRVILFSDIQPFLFPIRSPEVRLQLIYAFLNFLGLPFTSPDMTTNAPSAADPHLQWTIGYNSAARKLFWPAPCQVKPVVWQTVGGEPMEPERSRAVRLPSACPVKSWAQDRATLFSRSKQWYRDIENIDLEHVDANFVRSAIFPPWYLN